MNNHEELVIHDLVARYTDALVRDDADAWAATWASDATWDLGGFVVEGIDAIVDLWQRATAPFACIVQIASSPMIRFHDDGVTAHGRWTIVEYLSTSEAEPTMHNIGIYDDDYRVVDGSWRFAARRFQPLFSGTHSLTPPAGGYSVITAMR